MKPRQDDFSGASALQIMLAALVLSVLAISFASLFAAARSESPESETSPRRVRPNGGPGLKVQESSADFTVALGPTATPTPSLVCGTFANPAPIALPFTTGISSPYPSDIAVSGVGGGITNVTIALNGLTHGAPSSIDVLLVGPGGQSAIIMSDAGANFSATGINLVLDDSAANPLSNGPQLVSGTYQPTNIGECVFNGALFSATDEFPAPAPTPAGSSALSVFNGTNPNGTWSLYVFNDSGGTGNFSGGWSLIVSTDNCAGPTATPRPTPTPGGTTHFAVVAPFSCNNGTPCVFTVTALDEANNTVTSYPGTVHFTSSDRFGPQLPGDSQLINGSGTFSAGLNNLFGHDSITATDTGDRSITGTSNCILVLPSTPPTPSPTPTATATPPVPTPVPTPTPAITPTPAPDTVYYIYQNFDQASPPALPWATSFTNGAANCTPTGTCPLGTNWVTSTINPIEGPISAFHDAPGCVTDSVMETNSFFIFSNLDTVGVNFLHNFDLESGRDGGVLEISYDGGCFVDIVEAGGSANYNGTIATGFLSPISGRNAWTGNGGGVGGALLPASAKNHSVKLRFRIATDCSGSGVGWRVDRVDVHAHISGGGTPAPTPTPSPTPVAPPAVCSLTQGFDSVGALTAAGWIRTNNSNEFRNSDWDNGDPARFSAQTGASNSYVAVRSSTGCGTISNWLITPPLTLQNGAVFAFWTRTVDTPIRPDRVQVRRSTSGNSFNVGTSPTSVGDFGTLLLDINPTYDVAGYPNVWTHYTITVSGLGSPVTGRFAFRYFVENGGPSGVNSDYIGIDTVSYTCVPSTPTATPTPTLTPTPTPCEFGGTPGACWGYPTPPPPTPTATPNGKIVFSKYSLTVVPPTPVPFEEHYEIYMMDSNGANRQALTSSGTDRPSKTTPNWSPDGTKVVYLWTPFVPPFNYALHVLSLGGGDIDLGVDAGQVPDPAWSPDGTKIAYHRGTIRVVNANGSNPVDLGQSGLHPSWSPDQTKIAFSNGSSIWVMNADGSNPMNLTGNQSNEEPAWSNDGTRIAFSSTRDGNSEIYVMNADGTNQIRLTYATAYDGWPTWSPDSGQLAFESGRDGYSQIYVMNVDGTSPHRISNSTFPDRQPNWQRLFALPTPSPSPTVTPTPTPSPGGPAQAKNLSTRLRVETGNNVGIGGFIITGTAPRQVLLRGIGPSLVGVGQPLADPLLELHGPGSFVTITNNNWKDTQQAAIEATGIPPSSDLESAILVTLDPGAYTAILSGNNNGTGVGLVEIYDLNQGNSSKLANLSTRAFVSTGSDIVIAGFILGGGSSDDFIVVRGIGPSLTNFGVPNALANPTLELRNGEGALVIANDDWQSAPPGPPVSLPPGLAPTNPLESAMAVLLPPGAYTALLSGVNNGTGVGLVEVYDLGAQAPTPTPTPGGGTPTPTPPPATPTPTPGTCIENFDGVTAPALPPGWVASNPEPGNGVLWVTSPVVPDTPPNAAFIDDQDGISDKVLDSRPLAIHSATAQLTFRNNYDTEFSNGVFCDGGVLEISAPNIGGGDFIDFTDSRVGASCQAGCYNAPRKCSDAPGPIGEPAMWAGTSNGYIDTIIDLGPNLSGQTIKLRWRFRTDEAVVAPGWRIDTVWIDGATCP